MLQIIWNKHKTKFDPGLEGRNPFIAVCRKIYWIRPLYSSMCSCTIKLVGSFLLDQALTVIMYVNLSRGSHHHNDHSCVLLRVRGYTVILFISFSIEKKRSFLLVCLRFTPTFKTLWCECRWDYFLHTLYVINGQVAYLLSIVIGPSSSLDIRIHYTDLGECCVCDSLKKTRDNSLYPPVVYFIFCTAGKKGYCSVEH